MRPGKKRYNYFSTRRLRLQGWLLMAVWWLLAAALGHWLYSSFLSAVAQQQEAIVSLWKGAQLHAVDPYRVATKVFSLSSDSVVAISDSLLPPPSSVRTIKIKRQMDGDNSVIHKVISSSSSPSKSSAYSVVSVGDAAKEGSVSVQKAEGVEMIVIGRNDPHLSSRQVIISTVDSNVANSIDTAKLRSEFTRQLEGRKLRARWQVVAAEALEADSAQLYVDAGDGNYLVAEVENQRAALLWGLLPAGLGVAFVLLLAGSALLAFYKSQQRLYRLMLFQQDFARNMAHEMRTPLATLRLILESLRQHNDAPRGDKHTEYLALASRETDRLISLAERLSAAVRSGDAKIVLSLARIDLMDLLRDSIAMFQPAAAQANATITLTEFPNGVPFVDTDVVYLRSVVDNLIDNALKYGGNGVELVISVEQHDRVSQVHFADNGPGISPEHAQRVFDRFYRVPTGDRLPTRGLGVGLFFCREAMRALGGDIALQYNHGIGTCFTITIPTQLGD